MTRYPIQPTEQIFVKGYEFLTFAIKLWVKLLVKL